MAAHHVAYAILPLWIAVGPLASAHRAGGQAPPTLCTAGERVIFSAALERSTKLVSLCSSHARGDDPGAYVQYRFGRPGRIELRFPEERANSRWQFNHEDGAGRDKAVWFETNGFRYQISEMFPPRGERGQPSATLTVFRADALERPVATFTCRTPYRGGLADF